MPRSLLRLSAVSCALTLLPFADAQSDTDLPLVYTVENTGESFAPPLLPSFGNLPVVHPLTDPFAWSDGSGRSTDFSDWARRRAEIKAEVEHYEIGAKPPRPDDITASFADDTLTVNATVNGETLTLTATIDLPEGDGPFPAIIGIFRPTGSLPPEIFTERNIASVAFDFTQVMSHSQTHGEEPINRLYPDQTDMGAYAAWPWGISRIIDGLELVQDDLPIDLRRLAVSGCSFAGKMALFAGAFDERIALTIAQEPGGGGAAAWRVSETLGEVEKLGRTNYAWFKQSMRQFAGNDVSRLPHDHHELIAMIAPRAVLIMGNTDYTWLADESGYVSARAAQRVWQEFGIADRFGFTNVGGHPHCQVPASQVPEIAAFVDRFLLGIESTDISIWTHQFDDIDHEAWTAWWGTGEPTYTPRDDHHDLTVEAEHGDIGTDWETHAAASAAGDRYVSPVEGAASPEAAPTGSDGLVQLTFTIDTPGRYSLFFRLNCPDGDSDSLWVQVDDEEFYARNGLGTNGWDWVTINRYHLDAGEHTLTVGFRESGVKLDQVLLSTYPFAPDPE